jgi:GTP cyclohydrolase I
MKQAATADIPDVQGSADKRHIAINKVGIKDIRHPVVVKDRSDGIQHTIATFSMFVFLPHHFKGTHMSRFVKILNDHEKEISVESFKDMLKEMSQLLEADSGYIEMHFPYFVNKKAPISGVQSLLDYEVSLIGEINHGKTQTRIKVQVPVTSLCPCSKSISDYGAHNQRSHVTVDVKTQGFVWIEEIIDMVEKQAS